MIDWWRNKCGAGGMRRIFDSLIDAFPRGLSRQELAGRAGLAMSGTLDTYISRLRTLGLIEGQGTLSAASELFN